MNKSNRSSLLHQKLGSYVAKRPFPADRQDPSNFQFAQCESAANSSSQPRLPAVMGRPSKNLEPFGSFKANKLAQGIMSKNLAMKERNMSQQETTRKNQNSEKDLLKPAFIEQRQLSRLAKEHLKENLRHNENTFVPAGNEIAKIDSPVKNAYNPQPFFFRKQQEALEEYDREFEQNMDEIAKTQKRLESMNQIKQKQSEQFRHSLGGLNSTYTAKFKNNRATHRAVSTKKTDFNSRVFKAHQELQQFFAKFENSTQKDTGLSRISDKNSLLRAPSSSSGGLNSNGSQFSLGFGIGRETKKRRETLKPNKRQLSNVFYDLKNCGVDSEPEGDFKFEELPPKKREKLELEKSAQEKLSQFQFIRLLGSGAYAQVKLAQHKVTKQRVAVKIYPKYKLNDPSKRKAVQREIQTMKMLSHPYVCKLYDHFETGKEIYLIQEYVSGISLYQFMRNKGNKPLALDQARFFIKQLCECLKYLHSANKNKEAVVHRDLKLENIIIDDRNNIKLIDFGFAVTTFPGHDLKTCCGTPSYMAPEICQRKPYSGFATDVWSVGIILFVILTGSHPFKGVNEKDLFAKISRGLFRIPETIDFEAKRLIGKILVLDPSKRPRAIDILNDRWLK